MRGSSQNLHVGVVRTLFPLVVVLAAGCGLEGLSSEDFDPQKAAQGLWDCTPGSIVCNSSGATYSFCPSDGDLYSPQAQTSFLERPCQEGHFCLPGSATIARPCVPLDNQCRDNASVSFDKQELFFNSLAQKDTKQHTLELSNCGPDAIEINEVSVQGSAFSKGVDSGNSFTVQANNEALFQVLYHPSFRGIEERGQLLIDATKVDTSGNRTPLNLMVPLRAAAQGPFTVEMEPSLDFGGIDLNDTTTMNLSVRHSNVAPLTILGIESVGAEHPSFTPRGPEQEGLVLPPDTNHTFQIAFHPTQSGYREGRYALVISPWPQHIPRPEFTVSGIGVDPHIDCPRAQLTAQELTNPRNTAQNTNDVLVVTPMSRIRFDASQSTTHIVGTRLIDFDFSVLYSPLGSASTFLPLAEGDHKTDFVADLVGYYQIGLDVKDNRGRSGCERYVMTAQVLAKADMHVELTWFTPGDPVMDTGPGAGTDLDLHIIREKRPDELVIPSPNPTLDGQGPYACSERNPVLDFGDPSLIPGNCQVLRSDNDGWGPEIIELQRTEQRSYIIDVHVKDDAGYGGSKATINIYLGGREYSISSEPLLHHRETWRAVRVWPDTGRVEPIDEIGE